MASTIAPETRSAELPLTASAQRLRFTYHRALNALLSGRLRGRQNEQGRWMVEVSSLEEFERARTAE